MWKFQGSIRKEVEFPGGDQEKITWNFHGSWLFELEFPWCVSLFCRIPRDDSLFSLEFPRLSKVTNLKILGFFFIIVCPCLPCLNFF